MKVTFRAALVSGLVLLVGVPAVASDDVREPADRDRHSAFALRAARGEIAAGMDASPRALPVDADDDGMDDSWETARGLNPADPSDAWLDPDGDQVLNLFEYQLGSEPGDPLTPPVVTVAPTGADYPDPTTAMDAVAPGTVIRVAGGTYPTTYMVFAPKTLMLQGGWAPDFSHRDLALHPTTLDGGGTATVVYISPNEGSSSVILDGLRIVGGYGWSGAVNLIASGTAVMRSSLSSCVIAGSTTSNEYGGVVSVNSWDSAEADRTFVNTQIAGNQASGPYGQVTGTSVSRWRFVNTTISDQHNGGGSNGYGIDVFTLDTGVLTASLSNTILWGNEQTDLDISGSITFSAQYSDVGLVEAYGVATYTPGAGMISTDPLLSSPATGDYHLTSGSPCVDHGTELVAPLTDFEGDPRPNGLGIDIGADETRDALFADGFESGDTSAWTAALP